MPIKVQHFRKRGARRRSYNEIRATKLAWADSPQLQTDPFIQMNLEDRRRYEADIYAPEDLLEADQVEDGPPSVAELELAEHLDYRADNSPMLFKSY